MTNDRLMQLFKELEEKIMVIEMRLNALEAWRDGDETYKMEQNEYK